MGLIQDIFYKVFGTPEENRRSQERREREEKWRDRKVVEIIHRYPSKKGKKGRTRREVRYK